jgi:hypothetical protein
MSPVCLSDQIVELNQRLEQTEKTHKSAVADLTANYQRQREQDIARCGWARCVER